MKKTSVYFEPDLDQALDRSASEAGMTKAEFIRRALRRAVADEQRPRISAIGLGEGPGDVAGAVDRNLRESGFGSA